MKTRLLNKYFAAIYVTCCVVCVGAAYGHYLATPCGTYVDHSHPTPDWSQETKDDMKAALEAAYPYIVVVGEATRDYNCHSYCWAGNTQWIDDPYAYYDSYEVDMSNGPKLTYAHCLTNNPAHSANDLGWYTAVSKWGSNCLVVHDWDNVPGIYGSVVAQYSARDECGCWSGDDCDD